jgi:hypothetical protein
MTVDETSKIAAFEGKNIRKIFHEGEWWFSAIDIVEVLTGSSIPRRYWSDLKKKLISEGFTETYEKIVQLKMPAPDGKMRLTDCADTETVFRIIQSIPSPKVEPLKRWLAKVGKERIDEIENLELSMERMKSLYEKKASSSFRYGNTKTKKGRPNWPPFLVSDASIPTSGGTGSVGASPLCFAVQRQPSPRLRLTKERVGAQFRTPLAASPSPDFPRPLWLFRAGNGASSRSLLFRVTNPHAKNAKQRLSCRS